MFDEIPDIAKTSVSNGSRLDKVGMSDIEVPLHVELAEQGLVRLVGRADAFVSLDDPHSKGIHMSRIFLALQNGLPSKPLSLLHLHSIVQEFLESHRGVSHQAFLDLNFELPLIRKALLTKHEGWRTYPIKIETSLNSKEFSSAIEVVVRYSSTCPCSAALARQVIQKDFARKFPDHAKLDRSEVLSWLGSEEGISATPHGQRSEARVWIRPQADLNQFDFVKLIDEIEAAVKTPVQAVVKREDEQEFARLNAQNLMFAEDAARRIKMQLSPWKTLADFRIKTTHFESLHPHNAVALASKDL